MARRNGPPPKPRELKLVQGTLRKSRDRGPVDIPPGVPDRPAFLDDLARQEWDRTAPVLEAARLLTDVDRAALAAYCESWSMYVRATERVQESGEVMVSPKGYLYPSPWVGIANTAKKQMLAFLAEFGMTPSARTRVKPAKAAGPTNPFSALPGAAR